MVKLGIIGLFLLTFILLIKGQDYSITYLDKIYIFYPESTLNPYCPSYQRLFFVQKINETADSIQTLDSDNQSCLFIEGNITSSTFLCTEYKILNFSNYSTTFFVNNDISKGSFLFNYECKRYEVTIEIIQEVTWSIINKFSSIVKLNGLLDSTRIETVDNYFSFDLISLGKNYYRIRYYENFYIPRLSNSNWETSFSNSGTIIVISVPYNITICINLKEYKNSNKNEEIVELTQFPNDVHCEIMLFFGGVIKFKSISSLQRPINPLVLINSVFSTLPRPISGSIGNMTYISYLLVVNFGLQNYSLYEQINDTTFQSIPVFINYTSQIDKDLTYSIINTTVDNSTNSMSLYSFELSKSDIGFKYDSQYLRYSYGDSIFVSENKYQVFPFGFSSGNNLNYKIKMSLPTRGFSNRNYFYLRMSFLSGIGPELRVTPSSIVNDTTKPILKSYETIYLNNFYYLIRFIISDTYGLNYIQTIIDNNVVEFHVESLVSGDIKNGVFEILYDALKSGSTKNSISLFNHLDSSSVYSPFRDYSLFSHTLQVILPSIQLKSVEYLKDIKDISFMFNDVDIVDQTVDNIIYFSFNNIDNYKNSSIAFTLIDPRTLQDSNFINHINQVSILNSVYSFAVWDEINSRFYIKFRIPANTSPGVLDWMLIFNKENYILNTQLPDEYQLRIGNTKFDSYGPIVTSIVRYQDQSSTATLGWFFTIEDEINGFKDGYVTIRGSIDSSLYNFTLKLSDMVIGSGDKWKGNYIISIPYILNDCVSQNYEIYYAVFIDTFGNVNKYYKRQTNIELDGEVNVDSSANPFIKYINDMSILQVSTLNMCNKTDSTLPELKRFWVSRSSIDVGSLERLIVFDFNAQDLDGLKDDQYPIVYITDMNSRIHECISTIVTKNRTDIEYTCTMEVPIGFSHPYGFLISVYGFINRGGSYSGYSASDLKDSGFTWFVETKEFSVTQPIITDSSAIDNDGGDLWLYGRGFKSTNNVVILSSNGESYSSVMTVSSDSVILIKNVKPTNDSINVQLTNIQQPTILSNTFTIFPKVYYFNYSAPTPTPTFTSSPTPTSTNSPTPTNKPQICLGNPVCGGSEKGYCKENVGCICYSPYVGLDCSSKVIIIPQPKPNEDKPTIIIDNKNNNSSNVNNNYQIKSNISIIAIREVNSVNGEQVKIHYIDKWYYNSISPTISNYQSTIINNNITTTINATLEWFENKSNITFANQELIMNPSTIKYTVELSSYKFSNKLNNLQVIMEAQIQSNENDICSGKEFGDTTLDNSNYIKLQVSSNSIYGRFLKRGIVDGKTVTISNELLDSKLNSISNENNVHSYIGIVIGQYETSVIIDPDFSLLLDNQAVNSNSPNSICSSSESSLTKSQLAGIIVGSIVFFIVLVIIVGIILFSKSIHIRIIIYKIFKKSKKSY
ncbi:hypothetical protein ACTFIR_000932 [Dictyostelium discoideum]